MIFENKLKYGMVGGGPGALIGHVHRKAIAMDGNVDLVAGAFSIIPQESYDMGKELFLNPNRVYGTYQEMLEKESKMPEDQRLDFVTIVTPNYLHFPMARDLIKQKFNIVIDKPMVCTVQEAEELCRLVKDYNVIFTVTFNYNGYPMVKQAREMIKKGELGEVRKVLVEFHQGWLSTFIEGMGESKAIWRTNPKMSGCSLAVGDIGSHAENLIHYMTGLKIEKIFADLTTFIPGRTLDDDGTVIIHFTSGARGILTASPALTGERNNLRIRIWGSKASLEWKLEDFNTLLVRYQDGPQKIYEGAVDYLEPAALYGTRVAIMPADSYIESFSNIYRNVTNLMYAKKNGLKPNELDKDIPTVQDGARGVHFTNKVVESSNKGKWIEMNYNPPE